MRYGFLWPWRCVKDQIFSSLIESYSFVIKMSGYFKWMWKCETKRILIFYLSTDDCTFG